MVCESFNCGGECRGKEKTLFRFVAMYKQDCEGSKVQVRVNLGSVSGDREGGVYVLFQFEVSSSERFVKVRRLAKLAGMIGSFYLAMENVYRFHTRGMMSQIVNVIGKIWMEWRNEDMRSSGGRVRILKNESQRFEWLGDESIGQGCLL